jgi:putative hemolysin
LDTFSASGSGIFSFLHVLLAAPFPEATAVLILITLVLLFLLFFISGAEVALFSLTYKDISMLKTKQHTAARRITTFLENPKGLLGSLIIANIFLTIAIIILSNQLLSSFFTENHLWFVVFAVKVTAVAFVLVLFGQVLPKVWASQHNLRFAYYSSFAVEVVYSLFGRVSKPLINISDALEKRFSHREKPRIDGELLDYAIDELSEDEASKEEKQILKGIRKFGNTVVKQVMRSRLDVSGMDLKLSFAEVIKRVEELHYSRLPVYEETLDEIKGVIHTKDLLPFIHLPQHDWHTLIRPAYFVHEQKMIEDLLQEFRTKHIHFAIVVDEFGGTSGIVTLEDILEEVIGDIKDEFDEEETTGSKIDDNNYIFDGRTMINDACKAMNMAPDIFEPVRGDSDSVGGLVLEINQEIPQPGQVIPWKHFDFTVMETEKNRIRKVKITLKPE